MAYTTIKKSSDYFNTKLYTGDGTNGQNITGVGFQPDLCWIKDRSAAQEHMWYDAVRGNNSAGDATTSTTTYFTSFDSDGFTVGSESALGGLGANLVGWNWLGANGTTANTDGSISSTVSANTTSGFSIVSYTGNGIDNATVGHGLGVAPKMIILKRRDALDNWYVMHTSLSTNNALNLDTTNAQMSTSILTYGVLSTSPTSSTFSFAAGGGAVPTGNVNNSGSTYIAYCFAEKQGFSKFGSYTGNGSTDGTFVYTGFKPAFVMIKRTNSTGNWLMFDSKRDGFNSQNDNLYANTTTAEQSDGALDIFSNGFKCTVTGTDTNGSGSTYIYMAFAEQPLVGDNPATAR
jgi:hypothetical protein